RRSRLFFITCTSSKLGNLDLGFAPARKIFVNDKARAEYLSLYSICFPKKWPLPDVVPLWSSNETRTVIPPDDLGRGAEDQHIECHALYIAVRDVAVRPKAKLAAADSAALTEDAVDCLDSGLIDLNAPLKLVFHVPALKWFG
ncbi:hypothetical protein BC938DRAFT_471242, partial [Jimgerdemannia flammicorona]